MDTDRLAFHGPGERDLPGRVTNAKVAVVVALHDEPVPETIRALATQTVAADLEVVIVDSCHHEPTRRAAARAVEDVRGTLDVRLVTMSRAGRASSWNRGIAETTAPLVLLIGQDFIAPPWLVEEHLRLHERRPQAHIVGVGPALFPEQLRNSRFRRWAEDSGRIFGVSFTHPDPELLRRFFFGGNSSLKRSFLRSVGGFDERFPMHGIEDFELGLRLGDAGAEFVFLPRAAAEHPHAVTLHERAAVAREAGKSLRILEELRAGPYPWREIVTQPSARLARSVALRWIVSMLGRGGPWRERYYRALLDRALAQGYRKASRRRASAPARGSQAAAPLPARTGSRGRTSPV